MSFFGKEVRPGFPYVHAPSDGRTLHITQATLGYAPLGYGTLNGKTILRCNTVGSEPILLCSLMPGKIENASFDLLFKEEDEIVFSVKGRHSVFISGCFRGDVDKVATHLMVGSRAPKADKLFALEACRVKHLFKKEA